jgi:ketosteroid isomerase-like protein
MPIAPIDQTQARRLFEQQIDCLIRDDKNAQMELYAEDLRYEFPFATDRPRIIEGREQFRAVMTPLWEEARRKGAKVTGCPCREFHSTDEPGLYVAAFTLDATAGGKMFPLPFVQLIRVRGGRIAEIREYFNPQARAGI